MTLGPTSAGRALIASAVFSIAALAVPFIVTATPPVTDLPQQSAQIGLFLEAWSGDAPGLAIQWLKPNNLSYVLLGLCWALVGPLAAGRLALGLIGAATVLALHHLARERRRSLQAASLATVFFFSHTLYWGFFNFLIAVPLFLVFVGTMRKTAAGRLAESVRVAGFAVLFAASHILWLPVALGWLAVSDVSARRPWKRIALRAAPFAVMLAVAAIWVAGLPARGFHSETIWGDSIGERFLPVWWSDAALGGLSGEVEAVFVVAVLVWMFLGLWQHRHDLGRAVDAPLLATAAGLLALSLALPIKFNNVIFLSQRWVPVAMMLLLVSLPAPRADWKLIRLVPPAVLAGFALTTAGVWMTFERTELRGLETSLAGVPANTRLIELDFVKRSRLVRNAPFLHLSAYAQLRRPVDLNFTFAQHATSLVVHRDAAGFPWQRGLVWSAERVRDEDLAHFDFALVQATDEVHAEFARRFRVEPLGGKDRWRLYRVPAARVLASR